MQGEKTIEEAITDQFSVGERGSPAPYGLSGYHTKSRATKSEAGGEYVVKQECYHFMPGISPASFETDNLARVWLKHCTDARIRIATAGWERLVKAHEADSGLDMSLLKLIRYSITPTSDQFVENDSVVIHHAHADISLVSLVCHTSAVGLEKTSGLGWSEVMRDEVLVGSLQPIADYQNPHNPVVHRVRMRTEPRPWHRLSLIYFLSPKIDIRTLPAFRKPEEAFMMTELYNVLAAQGRITTEFRIFLESIKKSFSPQS